MILDLFLYKQNLIIAFFNLSSDEELERDETQTPEPYLALQVRFSRVKLSVTVDSTVDVV